MFFYKRYVCIDMLHVCIDMFVYICLYLFVFCKDVVGALFKKICADP